MALKHDEDAKALALKDRQLTTLQELCRSLKNGQKTNTSSDEVQSKEQPDNEEEIKENGSPESTDK